MIGAPIDTWPLLIRFWISCFNHMHPLVLCPIFLWYSQNLISLYHDLVYAPTFSLIRGDFKIFSCNNLGRISNNDSPKGVKFLLFLWFLNWSCSCMIGWYIPIFSYLNSYNGWLDCFFWYAWYFLLHFLFWLWFFLVFWYHPIGSWPL